VIDRLAASDERVTAFHIDELPAGWLGKHHAMHRGVEQATGDWLLFTDADVHFEPGTLRRAVAYCIEHERDHLAILPQFWPASFLLGCTLATFLRIICLSARVWAVEDPDSSAAIGVGAFNLVRREAFAHSGGFEELKMTVADDIGLGQILKDSGARAAVLNGRNLVGLTFYRSLGEAARATEKAALIAFQFSYARLVLTVAAMLWCELAPLVALVAGSAAVGSGAGYAGPVLLTLGIIGTMLAWLAAVPLNGWLRMPLLPALSFPIGVVVSAIVVIRAGVLAAWRGGHQWRGVVYPNDVLRAGNRLRFP
jgi:hypothetical protein